MDIKAKIIDNVKKQATCQAQLQQLQETVNEVVRQNNKLQGGIEVLSELLKDDLGITLEELIEKDKDFSALLDEASKIQSVSNFNRSTESPNTTKHTSNQKVTRVEGEKESHLVGAVNKHKIVINDAPQDHTAELDANKD